MGWRPSRRWADLKFRVERLSLWYGENQALHNVTLGVPPHAVTALIGPSGCGKSSFLRCLNLMHELTPQVRIRGRILLDGHNILPALRAEAALVRLRRRIGMVFQRPNPFPVSIYENVAFGLRLQGETNLDEAVEESLRAAALWDEVKDRLYQPALALSGGQQQRLCIARALAIRPDVLLLDEPCSALDPASTARVEELINTLTTILTPIIVTHSMAQGARLANNGAFFLNGRLIEAGPHLFTTPHDSRTADYLAGRFG